MRQKCIVELRDLQQGGVEDRVVADQSAVRQPVAGAGGLDQQQRRRLLGDGNGQADLIVDLGKNGLWAQLNGAEWRRLTALSPERMVAVDLDMNGKDDVLAKFARLGILVRYNESPMWVKPRTFINEAFLGWN